MGRHSATRASAAHTQASVACSGALRGVCLTRSASSTSTPTAASTATVATTGPRSDTCPASEMT
ncbi:hypothetical protein DPMN_163808 [Dreissena polymorpha]|uniref:Uncharacterized protein n=1 Tax=Dreissena polymorpha TaxID=45954 RepID=A0A9D4ETZ4_DREPO|nr:hypothetical protein DPMN_163808 [Dreissena polymorpha]